MFGTLCPFGPSCARFVCHVRACAWLRQPRLTWSHTSRALYTVWAQYVCLCCHAGIRPFIPVLTWPDRPGICTIRPARVARLFPMCDPHVRPSTTRVATPIGSSRPIPAVGDAHSCGPSCSLMRHHTCILGVHIIRGSFLGTSMLGHVRQRPWY